MNNRPHSNSIYRSKLVTKGERHRRRSRLIVQRRQVRHTQTLIVFSETVLKVFVICLVIGLFVFIITR